MLCNICQQREATHKNSHLIPSFLTARIFNPDNVNNREKALAFTILDREVKVSTKGLSDIDNERIFENLPNDERIDNELRIEAGAVPFIFCPKCENHLSRYIESPYSEAFSQNKEIDGSLSMAFWASVIWRLAISNSYEKAWVKGIPDEFVFSLGSIVREYIYAKENGNKFSISPSFIYYRIIRGNETDSDFIYGIPNPSNGEYLLHIGNTSILYKFTSIDGNQNAFFENINLFFSDCKKNTGYEMESILNLSSDRYNKFKQVLFQHAIVSKQKEDCVFLDELWSRMNLPGPCPKEVKIEFFKRMYSSSIKLGDRHTFENKKKVLSDIFIDLGIIQI